MRSPFAFLDHPTDAPILIDAEAGRVWTQQELADVVDTTAETLATGRRELVFCLCRIDTASIVGYLSTIRAGHSVAMLDARVPDNLTDALIDLYSPAFVLRSTGEKTPAIQPGPERASLAPEPAKELAVLLSTSGTTGSPKLARLSHVNIVHHTESIATYLEIDERERAIQSLPIHFSYGLSVLNTHLATGASLIVSPHSIMRPEFWSDASRWGATSFAGVPYSYAVLERTGLLRKAIPETMRTLTQSGGRLAPEAIVDLHTLMTERGGRVFVMYGQTESTARMTYVPPDALPEKAHTVGIAIPGGHLSIRPGGGEETTEAGVEGEVIYQGPNVMMGYAEKRDELELGDVLNGVLRTGDLGVLDEDGFLRLTGRTKRIAKVFGLRVNLDEIEAAASSDGMVAVVDGGDQIVLWRLSGSQKAPEDLQLELAARFGLKSRAFSVRDVDDLPLNGRGKVDYHALTKRLAN
jgi:acyl-CoA synthetase (AMP-forming)/AMP-acid ligase II